MAFAYHRVVAARIEPRKVILAFFDVLEFADRVAAGQVLELYETYRQLEQSLGTVRAPSYSCWLPREFPDYCNDVAGLLRMLRSGHPVEWVPGAHIRGDDDLTSLHFSDTLMFWSDDDPIRNGEFVDRVIDFFCRALEMGVPLRGAVTRGDLIFDHERSIVIGPALVEAARAESAQAWCGVGLGPSFRGQLVVAPNDRTLAFEQHIKPGSDGEVLPVAVDWTWHWRTRNRTVGLESIAGSFDNHRYWEPTLAFDARSRAAGDRGHMPIFDLNTPPEVARNEDAS